MSRLLLRIHSWLQVRSAVQTAAQLDTGSSESSSVYPLDCIHTPDMTPPHLFQLPEQWVTGMTPTPLTASQRTGPSTCPSLWEVLHVTKSSGCRLQDYVSIMEWALTWIEGGAGTRSQHSRLFPSFPPRALPWVSRCFSIMVATYNIEYVLNWK